MPQNFINVFLEALYSVIPADLLRLLTIEDLEKLLVGVRKIDINDWKLHTRVTGNNMRTSHIVCWFWEILKQLNDKELRKFLQFWTGCQSVPIEGFWSLKNNRQESWPFTIKLMETDKGMIRAHTWFNRIELPLFRNKEDLKENIQYILNQSEFVFDFVQMKLIFNNKLY